MAVPTTDEQLDAIAADVASGVQSATTDGQSATLAPLAERVEAVERLAKIKAARRGVNGVLRVSRCVPPGSDPG